MLGIENATLAYIMGTAAPRFPVNPIVAATEESFPGWYATRSSTSTLATSEDMVTLYRNFGPNELRSIKETGGFSIGNGFAGKQFWIGEEGWNWWKSTDFAKPHNAKLSIPRSFITPGNSNYIFIENGYDLIDGIPHIDGYPGGTVAPDFLKLFNNNAKIDWLH